MLKKLATTSGRLFVLLAPFLFLFHSCISYKEVEFYGVEHAKIDRLTPRQINLTLKLKIKNPNDYQISVTHSDLAAYVENQLMGEVMIMEPLVIPAMSDEQHNCKVEAAFTPEFSGRLGEITDKAMRGKLEVRVSGEIKAEALNFSKTMPIDITENLDF